MKNLVLITLVSTFFVIISIAWNYSPATSSSLSATSTPMGRYSDIITSSNVSALTSFKELNPNGVASSVWSPDGMYFVVLTASQELNIYETNNFELLRSVKIDFQPLHLAFNFDGSFLILSGRNVSYWDFKSLEPIFTFKYQNALAISASPSENIAAWGPFTDVVYVRDIITGKLIHEFHHDLQLSDLIFDPNGQILFAVGENQTEVLRWDLTTGDNLESFVLPTLGSQDMAITEMWLATANADETISIFDPVSGNIHLSLQGTGELITEIDFNAAGDILASTGGYENMGQIWDSKSGKLLSILQNPYTTDDFVGNVSFNPDSTLLSLSTGTSISIWRVSD